VDTLTDAANCNGCNQTCPADHTCVGGTCTISYNGPLPNACNDSCVDFTSDPANCNGCSSACPAGFDCSMGVCVLCSDPWPNACNGGCYDFSSDPLNCNGCGNICDGSCVSGQCVPVCASGETLCGLGTPEVACVTLTEGASCCSAGQTSCEGSCVATTSDWSNCGSCNSPCPSTLDVCVSGVCTSCNLAPGHRQRSDMYGNNYCNNIASDPQNCGACGNGCGGTSAGG